MKLLLLRCPKCNHALAPGQDDQIMQCPNCRSAVALNDGGLEQQLAQYAAPTITRPPAWLPFWVYQATVTILERKTQAGRSSGREAEAFWGQPRNVYIPAWACDLIEARDLVETCKERAAPLADRKQIRLEIDVAGELSLRADRELMEYALYNLITNAIKYSPPESKVRIKAFAGDGCVSLAVADRGIGMDAAELRELFRKFYRTKKAEATGEVGTGIGLSIVKEILAHHGGRVDVVSAPGEGSTFTLVVPSS